MDFQIIYEDEIMLVANKLVPLPVMDDKSGDVSLTTLLKKEIGKKVETKNIYLEPINRIDRRSSGMVIFSKTKKTTAILNSTSSERSIKKYYLVCVENCPPLSEDILIHRFGRNQKSNRTWVEPTSGINGPPWPPDICSTSYNVIGESEHYFLLQAQLITGRTHQIRAQLAFINCPIRGDLKYGAKRSTRNGLIMLHAWKLEFIHPYNRKKIISLTASPPLSESLWSVFKEQNLISD